jgi:hypothetical protein
MKNGQLNLFGDVQIENRWEEHYVGMPEYNNVREPDPLIMATFKFRTQEDFEEFNKLVKEHLYDGERVFDGMQRKDVKSTWYPLRDKASKYRFK